MKRYIASVLAILVFGWASQASAQSKGGDVSSGETGAPAAKKEEGPRLTADERTRFQHRVKDNDDLYDAVANFSAPRRDRILPWVVGLALGGTVMFMGLKHSFRNRYEG